MCSDAEAHRQAVRYRAPGWAEDFLCAAGDCPDSCCRAGWQIIPDPETLARYDSLPGPEGARIRAGIVPGHEPMLRQDENRVCVLLDGDGLCRVQRRFGHEALCRVCREYPRFHREYGALTERGISLSCPTAYGLATGRPLAWREWETEEPPTPNDLDPAVFPTLLEARGLALDLLAIEALPLTTRLGLIRFLARRTEADLRGRGRLRRSPAPGLRRRLSLARIAPPESLPFRPDRLARRFLELELLSPAWGKALEDYLGLDQAPDPWQTDQPEVYARYLAHNLFKYWLDALEDGRLLARVDRSLGMTLLGLALDRAFPGRDRFLQRISREVEHSEENLAALLNSL